eukprot:5398139-Pleurochrysis_carterae.AAC.2
MRLSEPKITTEQGKFQASSRPDVRNASTLETRLKHFKSRLSVVNRNELIRSPSKEYRPRRTRRQPFPLRHQAIATYAELVNVHTDQRKVGRLVDDQSGDVLQRTSRRDRHLHGQIRKAHFRRERA